MPLLERSIQLVDPQRGLLPVQYHPTGLSTCGKSLVFICTFCGDSYARFHSFVDGKISAFSAVHGCCNTCPGSRYYIPGSIEAMSHINWHDLPAEVLAYQLRRELDFTIHADHPHNQKDT